ncbi:conserved Plasmodium protein, unknown function [Plasmodium berghei]|uniref:START domain-containing protein n=2 Tax=Plasmodium berghei TaxID=5821 RepID=A0A509AGP6_PLABA|nr:conserved Plasmodium protein, unknown function [Plasmodium berghei ANKA]CXI30906.1 conserved Plasmodium protein, unknown function [Plasmodium berghei]SCM20925.1 conserved Plasmodium protein, unknown function [Plasmodium berghei]SCN24380.1 conserved Plasmodium protein, unknown function [Plasmodium berghei]SCO59560.1 conserved Plasmodium protein, unknown function [Plasmodium berghei]SCO60771.1 conserved Plasmodium protein, unknown function [Plasmodium berghei]|eukprot:XP_034421073.1 conserved Plasmodium protein, unknown function [Plasmodium berghei ANKA]
MESNFSKKTVLINDDQNENNEINSNGINSDILYNLENNYASHNNSNIINYGIDIFNKKEYNNNIKRDIYNNSLNENIIGNVDNEVYHTEANEQIINSPDNLMLSKSVHIFHSVKILIPNLKKGKNNEKETCQNRNETQNDEETKQENSDRVVSKNNAQKISILNNAYKNFKIYENEINQIEEKKINDEDKIHFVPNNLVKQIDIIKINKDMSEFYNDILEGINNFNLFKIRKSYHCIKNIFLKKYYNDKMIKTFMENILVSEILYRYKIIKKIEILFNTTVEDQQEYILNYSVISKKKYQNFILDYMIDLLDVNGKICPLKLALHANDNRDSYSYSTDNENKNDKLRSIFNANNQGPILEEDNFKDTKNYENTTLIYEQLLCENSKKKEMAEIEQNKHRLEKEDKKKHASNKHIKNSYIDFDNFQLAYEDINNNIYYFVTQNEFNDIDKKENSLKKYNNNHPNSSITRNENKQGHINTVIYFYLNLTIPSNFLYVVATVTESEVFKMWFPFYSFPFKFGVSECKIIKKRGFGDKIIYTRIAMPWIISDRYLLFDTWICEDFEFSKGIYIYTSSVTNNSGNINLGDDISKCEEINITMYGLILPKNQEETNIKYYIEICPNMHVNEYLISFLTKVFAKRCLSQFITACKNFETNKEYNDEMKKNNAFYDQLRKVAEECKIYN